MVPCGISDVTMTTVERELGDSFPGTAAVVESVVEGFGRVFSLPVERESRQWLDQLLSAPVTPVHTS
jgi:hypothetical protein